MLNKLYHFVADTVESVADTVTGSVRTMFSSESPHSMTIKFDTNNYHYDSIQIVNVIGGYEVNLIAHRTKVHTYTFKTVGTIAYWQVNSDGILLLEIEVK